MKIALICGLLLCITLVFGEENNYKSDSHYYGDNHRNGDYKKHGHNNHKNHHGHDNKHYGSYDKKNHHDDYYGKKSNHHNKHHGSYKNDKKSHYSSLVQEEAIFDALKNTQIKAEVAGGETVHNQGNQQPLVFVVQPQEVAQEVGVQQLNGVQNVNQGNVPNAEYVIVVPNNAAQEVGVQQLNGVQNVNQGNVPKTEYVIVVPNNAAQEVGVQQLNGVVDNVAQDATQKIILVFPNNEVAAQQVDAEEAVQNVLVFVPKNEVAAQQVDVGSVVNGALNGLGISDIENVVSALANINEPPHIDINDAPDNSDLQTALQTVASAFPEVIQQLSRMSLKENNRFKKAKKARNAKNVKKHN